jgi:hypothetical protein
VGEGTRHVACGFFRRIDWPALGILAQVGDVGLVLPREIGPGPGLGLRRFGRRGIQRRP